MAQIQDNIGIPTVEPATSAPDSTQRVNVSTDAFGGGIAQAGEKLGQGIESAGKVGFEIADFYGKVSVDDQINHLMTEAEKIRKGSGAPAGVAPDGQPTYDTGYMGLQGRAALDAREDTQKRLDAAIKAGRENLKTPAEQLAYDTQSRSMRRTWNSEIGTHADSQFKVWAQGVNDAGAGLAVRQIASNADNPEMVAHATADLINFRVKAVETKYGDDPAIKRQAIEGAKRDALTAQLEAISVKDPARAQQILETNKDLAGENYKTLATQFRERADHQIAIQAGTAAMGQAYGNVQKANPPSQTPDGKLTPAAVGSLILKQESNNNSNSPTSVDGAMGPGQIIPATFKQYAKPGESITNPNDNRAVSQRIIDDYYKRYDGDVQRIAVAYFSGPGNVAPPGSPTPYLEDRADGNGKRVSAYAQDVAMRANGNVGGAPQAMKADSIRTIMTNPELTVEQKSKAVQYVNQTYAQAQIAAEADSRAKKEANDKAAGDFVTRILNRQDVVNIIPSIANDPNLDYHTKLALQGVAEKHLGSDVSSAADQYGPGFWAAYKQVNAAPGEEGRITDYSQLLRMAGPEGGGALTLAGVEKLNSMMKENRKNPDAAAINTSKTGLINYAKGKLSFEQDLGPVKIADPKGQAIFNAQFIPKFEAAYAKWVGEGKNPWDFLTQENVDKLMTGMRSKDQMAQDRMKATGEAGTTEEKNAPLPPAPEGVDNKAWSNVVAKPPMLATGKEASKAQWGQALGILLQNPTPNTVAYFNKHFAADGYDGNEILKRFGKATTGTAAVEKPKEDDKPGIFGRSMGALKEFRDNNRAAIAAQSGAAEGTLPQ